MKTRGKLVVISGIDGAGKTTLARRLNKLAEDEGVDSEYIYGRVKPVISRMIIFFGRVVLLKRKKKEIFTNFNSYYTQRQKIFQNRKLLEIFIISFLMDQVIQSTVKITPRLWLGKTIFCDRYVKDTLIMDIAPTMNYSKSDISNMMRYLFKILPQPQFEFLLDIPIDTAFARKNDIPDKKILIEAKRLYDSYEINPPNKIIRLNGLEDIEKNCEIVQNIIY